MNFQSLIVFFLLATVITCRSGQNASVFSNAFVNFETAPVHPLALSPGRNILAVCNGADGKLELFDVTSGDLISRGTVSVGIDPVSVRFRNENEAWVVNQISDSISVVDVAALRITATISTLATPGDLVFAGLPSLAYVSCALPNRIQVFDPVGRDLVTNIVTDAERPKALAVSPDGNTVYAAIFESGNGTTVVGAKFRNLLFFSNAVGLAIGPYGGQNPPPNAGNNFVPPLNPALPTNVPAPATGIIVRKNAVGRWLDDNQRDWTEFVSGTNAALTQRVPGWDLPDRDLAIINTTNFSVSYATGLMNICMALDVNPVSGRIAVVGTEASNEVRFEPNLNGTFVRVKVASIDPSNFSKTILDLNPHLNYAARIVPPPERDRSIGDPRGIIWTSDGARAYVTGMGSRNLVVIDANGSRVGQPVELGEGPSGLALDEARQRLYVFNRFSSSVSVVNTATETVINAVPLFDPTPLAVAAGRRQLYDTRRTSGLGQASCASCHVDARLDRLGWDLGNPAGDLSTVVVNSQGTLVTNDYHPMKGVMVTQTLQDIIGHEPFHWRGDRPHFESFNATFTNLQAAATGLTRGEMHALREFLASVRFPPNRARNFDNSLATNVELSGHIALGDDVLPAGAPLPNGNAVAGLSLFNNAGNFCLTCHSLPTGLGIDSALQGGVLKPISAGTNGEHHFPLAFRLEGPLRSKIAQFRNLADKIGMDGSRTSSRSGFGFGHDGSVDTLTRFLNGVRVNADRDVADLIAFLLSVSGSDTADSAVAPTDSTPVAAVGRQVTINSSLRPALLDAMLTLAASATGRVDLIAKGTMDGITRGWLFDRTRDLFQSDRQAETMTTNELLALAGAGSELTFTVVPRGLGERLGIDRDLDGVFDRDELDGGTNPADRFLHPEILAASTNIAVGSDLLLEALIPPLLAPGTVAWWKDGTSMAGATNTTLTISDVSFAASGDYSVVVTTPFQVSTSAPLHIAVAPLIATVSPPSQMVRRGSNATFTSSVEGIGPFTYQWQASARNLVGATNASLVLTNIQLADEGFYGAEVGNASGSMTSAPAGLVVLINPSVVIPPLSQGVVSGGNATFSLMIAGNPPPFGYQLRKSSTIVTNYISSDRLGFLTLFNAQPSNAGTYRVVVTNAANPAPGLSLDPVTLTILADNDHDGLPDEWEIAHGLDTNNVADAQIDTDGDDLTNLDEYVAGTDQQDAQSFLKVDSIAFAGGASAVVIQFRIVANKTYTVQSRTSLDAGVWTKLADMVAVPTNRLVSLTNWIDPFATRYYRLATPRVP